MSTSSAMPLFSTVTTTLNSFWKPVEKEQVDDAWVDFFYESTIPFHVVTEKLADINDSWKSTAIEKLVLDRDVAKKTREQRRAYKRGDGLFRTQSVIDDREDMDGDEWWRFYRVDTLELQHFAIQVLSQGYGSTKLEVELDGSVVYPGKSIAGGENGFVRQVHLPEPLTVDEELLMRIFYEQKIQEVCGAFKFPHKIQATAIIYFKRFYLRWSVMEHDPKHIMLTCIYTSCKVEEFHVSAEELGKGIQQDHQVILRNEMLVLQSLGFDLIVYSPYRSIDGFADDIEIFFQPKQDSLQKLKELREAAIFDVDKNMLTDAPLIFPPGQLALAALRRMSKEYMAFDFDRYLKRVCSRQKSTHTELEFIGILNDIDVVVVGRNPIAKDMRHVDRKLKHCRNSGLQDENKKREKKKHKSKRTSSDMQATTAFAYNDTTLVIVFAFVCEVLTMMQH
ncbi:hypothetical protein KI387_032600 [Taxus chinensis]|uniref:Cyclin-like domain-containing protein n=1 Tax=Taxus chinensis TaxID=29808 RepID=A0AA38C2P2_TAXCH|nr:hypothetical protein KI387_032600 [Taxus chinensis]